MISQSSALSNINSHTKKSHSLHFSSKKKVSLNFSTLKMIFPDEKIPLKLLTKKKFQLLSRVAYDMITLS